jgi:zinc transport system substrate-binding protein
MNTSRLYIIGILIVLGMIPIILFSLNKNTSPSVSESENTKTPQISIVTTLFPFYDISKSLVGEPGNVQLLVPPGVEPHSFEPTAQDIIDIQNADIFIYTGDTMEPWVKDIVASLPESVLVVDASQNISLIKASESHDHSHNDEHSHSEDEAKTDNHSDELDPHFWLDFENIIISVRTITTAIEGLNRIDSDLLSQNSNTIIQNLTDLDTQYRNTLSSCQNPVIIQAGHRTFEYLTQKYSIEYITTQELSPNSDTSAQDIAEIIKKIKAEQASTIFTEELIDSRIAQTIADETGASIKILNGAHNITQEQLESNTSFIDIMNTNLENLKAGLECK